jgi:hypothetical protein
MKKAGLGLLVIGGLALAATAVAIGLALHPVRPTSTSPGAT